MRVLEIFGEPVASGGQEAFIFNVLRHIDLTDLTLDFFTPYFCSNPEYRALIAEKGGELICAGLPFEPGKSRKNIIAPIKSTLNRANYDAVHIHSGSISVLAYASYAAHSRGIPKIIVHSHSTGKQDNLKHRLTKAYGAAFFHRYPTHFCACSLAAGLYKFPQDIVKNRLQIIPNGIELDRFRFDPEKRKEYREKLGIADGTVLIGHVGRFAEQKNHLFDLEILQHLTEDNRDVKMLWIGEGELEAELRRLANEKGLENYLIFQGVVSNVNDYLQAMDVFILPSLFEGLPIVGVEAQAAGLPVLASDRVSEELGLTNSVRFYPLGDAVLWADCILRFCTERLPENVQALQKAGYSIQHTAQAVRNLYCREGD